VEREGHLVLLHARRVALLQHHLANLAALLGGDGDVGVRAGAVLLRALLRLAFTRLALALRLLRLLALRAAGRLAVLAILLRLTLLPLLARALALGLRLLRAGGLAFRLLAFLLVFLAALAAGLRLALLVLLFL